MLPDIDFQKIRQHQGNQEHAFEELCCQLAALEKRPVGSAFFRKGRGADGGVECFLRGVDGAETGWQAKFYKKMDSSLLTSLSGSFNAALAKHPKLNCFVVCIPFDLSDGGTETTALTQWEGWRLARIADATASGRTVKIELWGASELKQRLAGDDPLRLGRTFFWFDVERLSPDWFLKKITKSIKELGARYTAETNVEIPIRRVLHAIARDPLIDEDREEWARALSDASRDGAQQGGLPEEQKLLKALRQLLKGFVESNVSSDEEYPTDRWTLDVGEALNLARLLRSDRLVEEKEVNPLATLSLHRLRDVIEKLAKIEGALKEDPWLYVNHRALLVAGDAGKGKSHLVADACQALVADKYPALLLLGSKFAEGDVWQQIIRELDLPEMTAKVFLGALDAAAEAAGTRLLLVIDGINERNGTRIWPNRLTGLLHDIAEFPRIGVVLTCRTTYLKSIIPESFTQATLPQILHSGFSSDDAKAYLAQRGMVLPTHPFPLGELQTPLFLKVCCDALDKRGENTFPKGGTGVSSIFSFYSDAVVRSLDLSMNLNASRRIPQRAIASLAKEMEETGEREISYDRAAQLVDSIYTGSGRQDGDLLFQLEAEGMVTKELTYFTDERAEESVRFVFERFGDHVVAKGVLDSITPGSELNAIKLASRLSAVLDENAPIIAGIREAIAVQLPEQFGVEILDVIAEDAVWLVEDAFVASLVTRDPSAISEHTMELLRGLNDDRRYVDCLVALAVEPATGFNAYYLHDTLAAMNVGERDSLWSAGIARNYAIGDGRTTRLLEWSITIDRTNIGETRASLAAIVFAWICSTTHKVARDHATRALVAVLSQSPDVAVELVGLFERVDDPYVIERITLAIYGAALQGTWSDQELVEVVRTSVSRFSTYSPPNLLIRDHLQSLVMYATYRKSRPEEIPEEVTFSSSWPLELVSDETIATYTRVYQTGHTSQDEIVRSAVSDGNFARYVIDKLVMKYSSVTKGLAPLTVDAVRAAWTARFNVVASPAKQAALKRLLKMESDEAAGKNSWHPSKKLKEAREDFHVLVGDVLYEEFRVDAMHWRRGSMFQDVYRSGGLACFNLAWARRWICKRAHDWGWSGEWHGDFDQEVERPHHLANAERIGKKYQWMALFELAARLEDHIERFPNQNWEDFDSLRRFDPTALAKGGGREYKGGAKAFWMPAVERRPNISAEEAVVWRDALVDLIDGEAAVEVTDPNGRQWLTLGAYRNWRLPSTDTNSRFQRELSSLVSCIVVNKADAVSVLTRLKARNLADSDVLPSHDRIPSTRYLGEHGWRSKPAEANPAVDWGSEFKRGSWRGIKCPAFATTAAYERENQDPDSPLTSVEFTLPSLWLMNQLNLRLQDGREVLYGHDDAKAIFWDPSAGRPGPSVGLIDRTAFLQLLETQKLVAIWGVGGEKNLYGVDGDGFGGRGLYSRLSYSQGDSVVHLDRTTRTEKPSKEQLRKFLGLSARGKGQRRSSGVVKRRSKKSP